MFSVAADSVADFPSGWTVRHDFLSGRWQARKMSPTGEAFALTDLRREFLVSLTEALENQWLEEAEVLAAEAAKDAAEPIADAGLLGATDIGWQFSKYEEDDK
jgi:hypothetical protein